MDRGGDRGWTAGWTAGVDRTGGFGVPYVVQDDVWTPEPTLGGCRSTLPVHPYIPRPGGPPMVQEKQGGERPVRLNTHTQDAHNKKKIKSRSDLTLGSEPQAVAEDRLARCAQLLGRA